MKMALSILLALALFPLEGICQFAHQANMSDASPKYDRNITPPLNMF